MNLKIIHSERLAKEKKEQANVLTCSFQSYLYPGKQSSLTPAYHAGLPTQAPVPDPL